MYCYNGPADRHYGKREDTEISKDTKEIKLKILAEDGFDPHKDVDLKSLKLGAPEEVNFGRGSTMASSETAGKDLIVTFNGQGNGVTKDNFAVKLIGRTTQGKLLFGYAKLSRP